TGIEEFDQLLGGGLTRGSSTLVIGPAGSGKSTFATQHVTAAAARGEKTVFFAFDEGLRTLFSRAESIGSDFRKFVEEGMIRIQQVDPAELSPGEFIHTVRTAVEEEGVCNIIIDSLNGYLNAMPEERFLVIQLHELLSYLNQKGVVTILVV